MTIGLISPTLRSQVSRGSVRTAISRGFFVSLFTTATIFSSAFSDVAIASETRGYVVSWFDVAGYADPKQRDCPHGLNRTGEDFPQAVSQLIRLGYSREDVNRIVHDAYNPDNLQIIINRGRINGRPANVYAHPESVPDPHIKVGEGRFGYGFDLDGKIKPGDFIDPESGARGIDNNLYRAIACFSLTREPSQPGLRATFSGGAWGALVERRPAHLIEISGIDNFENDEDVVVRYYVSLDHITLVSGAVAADQTMRVDPDPRWQNVVHGKIKNHVLTTEAFDLNLLGDPFWVQSYQFRQARLRLQFKPDGTAKGIVGGYLTWFPFYWSYASQGWGIDVTGFDIPGLYYALKRLADAFPDRKTGENTAISAAYEIDVVPAIISHTVRHEKGFERGLAK